ncbi:Fic family protein [Rhizobium sp. YTU87027]|uniref:Fic family protein n=1 Tax=Rhizobium sp. YTU87027 TaxID=3417741 RepID=UPI003D6873C0
MGRAYARRAGSIGRWHHRHRTDVAQGRRAALCRRLHDLQSARCCLSSPYRTGLFCGLNDQEFAERVGLLFAEINSIHAFREGNGRTQRAFFTELAKVSGHRLEFDVVSRERMTSVSIAAHEHGDASSLQRLFREISDPERVAALRHAQGFLDRHRDALDWRDHYMTTTWPAVQPDPS